MDTSGSHPKQPSTQSHDHNFGLSLCWECNCAK